MVRRFVVPSLATCVVVLLFQMLQSQAQQAPPSPPRAGGQDAAQHSEPPRAQAATLPHPVLDVPGLMRTFNGPLYRRLHELMQRAPQNEEQWNDIQYESLRAAEIANLIVIRQVPPKIVPTVMEHATELQKAGLDLDRAARSHNPQETSQSYQRLVQTCNACHKALAPDKAPQLVP